MISGAIQYGVPDIDVLLTVFGPERAALDGDTEVRELHALLRREDVRALDVAVQHALVVQVLQPAEHLLDPVRDEQLLELELLRIAPMLPFHAQHDIQVRVLAMGARYA